MLLPTTSATRPGRDDRRRARRRAPRPVAARRNAMRPVRGKCASTSNRTLLLLGLDVREIKNEQKPRSMCLCLPTVAADAAVVEGARRAGSIPLTSQVGVAPPSRRPGRATPGRPRPCWSAGAGSHRGRAAHSTPATSFRTRFTTPFRARLNWFKSKRASGLRAYLRRGVENRIRDEMRRASRRRHTSSRRSNRFGHPRITIRSISSTVTVSAVRS